MQLSLESSQTPYLTPIEVNFHMQFPEMATIFHEYRKGFLKCFCASFEIKHNEYREGNLWDHLDSNRVQIRFEKVVQDLNIHTRIS